MSETFNTQSVDSHEDLCVSIYLPLDFSLRWYSPRQSLGYFFYFSEIRKIVGSSSIK